MRRLSLQSVWLGLAVTLAALGADIVGVFTPWERLSIDYRFVAVPRPWAPMSGQIVHVDIDDGALDSVGRWPWDRKTLALVIDELRAAGARTIALDLILSDEQQYPAGTRATIDHDAEFAGALARARCVLAVDVRQSEVFDAVWRTARGREELDALLERLGEDIGIEPVEAAALMADHRLRGRFLLRPVEFERAAAWRRLRAAARPPASFEAFEQMMVPDRASDDGRYPAQPILRRVWDQREAWRLAASGLLPGSGAGTHQDRIARPQFAGAARGVGYVGATEQKHADGAVRAVDPRLPAEGGDVLQLGLAAAVLHLGLEPQTVRATEDAIELGETVLPLNRGRLWIDWPTSATEIKWEGLLRQDDEAPPTAGHVSIGAIVNLDELRATHRVNLGYLEQTAQVILETALPPGGLSEALIAEVDEQVEFEMPDYEGRDLDEEDRDRVSWIRQWLRLRTVTSAMATRIRQSEAILREAVADRLVFIGWTATGAAADFVRTPIGARTPGVIVHAAVASMALQGNAVTFLSTGFARTLLVLLGVLCTLAAARYSTLPSVLAAVGLLAAYLLVGGWWLFASHDLLVPIVGPVVAGAGSWIACTALQAALSQRERQRITRQFKARVSAQLVDHLVDNPESVTVSGEEREMTVIFSDLAGFTSIAESLGGPRTVSTLNGYMTELTNVLIAKGAYVNKFLGDGVMAFWSAFKIDPDQAQKACLAALDCRAAVERLNDDPRFEDIPKLGMRIGVATGRVVVGDCGAPPELNDYTAIGDAVNLAARLESANKQFGTGILINGRTQELIDDTGLRLRRIGRIIVVGQNVPVEVFELMPADAPAELIEITARAVDAFVAGAFAESIAAFTELEARFGESRLVRLYREAIDVVGDDFDGVLHLQNK